MASSQALAALLGGRFDMTTAADWLHDGDLVLFDAAEPGWMPAQLLALTPRLLYDALHGYRRVGIVTRPPNDRHQPYVYTVVHGADAGGRPTLVCRPLLELVRALPPPGYAVVRRLQRAPLDRDRLDDVMCMLRRRAASVEQQHVALLRRDATLARCALATDLWSDDNAGEAAAAALASPAFFAVYTYALAGALDTDEAAAERLRERAAALSVVDLRAGGAVDWLLGADVHTLLGTAVTR